MSSGMSSALKLFRLLFSSGGTARAVLGAGVMEDIERVKSEFFEGCVGRDCVDVVAIGVSDSEGGVIVPGVGGRGWNSRL